MIKQLQRKTIVPTQTWGLDSVQGILEYAEIFSTREFKPRIFDDPYDINNFDSPHFHFKQLEKEGYLNIQWVKDDKHPALIEMKQLNLTTNGRILLEDLRQKAKLGVLKRRIIDLLWVIATAIITTLITLKITT